MLRYPADRRTLLWCLAMPAVALAMYRAPGLIPFLCPVACYLALAAGLIAHHHHHCPTFQHRGLNAALSLWLSFFQGYPASSWIPIHNLNHHRFVNREGDVTNTWRYSRRHTWWTASTALFTFQLVEPTQAFVREARESQPALYRQLMAQYGVWLGTNLLLLGGAVALYGPWEGARVWLLASVLPALFAQWTLAFFSYIQHVHADAWSEHDHSRNFTGKLFNFLIFNTGYHTVHHAQPGAHWSTLPAAHARIERHVHPDLNVGNFLSWCFRSYVLALVSSRFGTRQLGRDPWDPPQHPHAPT